MLLPTAEWTHLDGTLRWYSKTAAHHRIYAHTHAHKPQKHTINTCCLLAGWPPAVPPPPAPALPLPLPLPLPPRCTPAIERIASLTNARAAAAPGVVPLHTLPLPLVLLRTLLLPL